jgi:hypothetical protein
MNADRWGVIFMFLHIGGSKIVFTRELIGIFDYNISNNDRNGYFNNCRESVDQSRINNEKPKSFVLTNDSLYISPIAPLTLAGRHDKKR